MNYNRNIGPRLLALLSVALWFSVLSITSAQTATSSTAQAGSVVSNAPTSAAASQTATNPAKHGSFVPLDQSQQVPTNAQTNTVASPSKLRALWNLPFDEVKKKAVAGDAEAQVVLGQRYRGGEGVPKDPTEGIKWFRKAAEQGNARGQYDLGGCYDRGQGVLQDSVEAVKWYRKAANQGDSLAQSALGVCYQKGRGVPQDYVEAVKCYLKAADQGSMSAQFNLGVCYQKGQGVPQDYIEAYKWYNLVAARWAEPLFHAARARDSVAELMTIDQIAEGQRRASQFVARPGGIPAADPGSQPGAGVAPKGNGTRSSFAPDEVQPDASTAPKDSGTGFLIADGYILTSYHVVKDADSIVIKSGGIRRRAKVVKVDPANDLALLWRAEDFWERVKAKPEAEAGGTVTNVFAALPILNSRDVHLGDSVFTLGFPNTGIQGVEPKLTRGDINSLSGIQDDLRFFQISTPVQPGNSGGPLVDMRGNVIGLVEARLDDSVALETSGALPQNVNYALKSSFILAFLDTVPELSGKLKDPHIEKDRHFNDAVSEVQTATVLVVCYEKYKVSAETVRRRGADRSVYAGVGSDHSIESVMDDGNLIKLEDGSLWKVSPLDVTDSALWLSTSEITVIEGDDPEYPYKLVNTDDNEVVSAQFIRQ